MDEPLKELRRQYGLNDTGNADRLAAAFGEDLIYSAMRRRHSAFALNPALEVSQYVHNTWKIRDGFLRRGRLARERQRKRRGILHIAPFCEVERRRGTPFGLKFYGTGYRSNK
jgi:hypothetical protein